jgi:hypothetical protein
LLSVKERWTRIARDVDPRVLPPRRLVSAQSGNPCATMTMLGPGTWLTQAVLGRLTVETLNAAQTSC